jgi:hypothetical protein
MVNFAKVDAACQQIANTGGVRRAFVILASNIVGNWPLPADIVDGYINRLPTFVAGAGWAEYIFPDGTVSFDSDFNNDPGYQSWKQMMEIALAGHSKQVRGEVAKFLNAGCVWAIEDKDGEFNIIGTTDDAVFVKGGFKGGKKGTDKKGYTLKGEVDGLPFDITPLKQTLVPSLVFLA